MIAGRARRDSPSLKYRDKHEMRSPPIFDSQTIQTLTAMIFIPIAILCLKYYQASRNAKPESDAVHVSETDDQTTRNSAEESNCSEDGSEQRNGWNVAKSCRQGVCVPPVFSSCISHQSRARNDIACEAIPSECVAGQVTIQAV
jgi:hypothetical protein